MNCRGGRFLHSSNECTVKNSARFTYFGGSRKTIICPPHMCRRGEAARFTTIGRRIMAGEMCNKHLSKR